MGEADKEGVGDLLMAFGKKLFGRDVVMGLLAIGAVSYATLKGRDSMAQNAQVQIDAGIKTVATETKRVGDALDEHLKDDREFRREVLRRLDEGSADTRALYKTVLTGEKSYRLERPLPLVPDGGP